MYLNLLFEPNDLVEIRVVDKSGDKPKLVRRDFLRPDQIVDNLSTFENLNAQGNELFVGVCPRATRGGGKEAVSVIRSVWADLDDTPESEAHWKWKGKLPEPTLLVASSDRGTHAYWRLEEPIDVSTEESRHQFEAMLQSLYQSIGADSCWDVSRILRLPSVNWKSFHANGKSPERCRIAWYSETIYSNEIFRPWFEQAATTSPPPSFEQAELPQLDTNARIDEIVSSLDFHTTDRSKRDFRVICELLRLGVTDEATLWRLVGEKSKFRGRSRYFATTVRNAARCISRAKLDDETAIE